MQQQTSLYIRIVLGAALGLFIGYGASFSANSAVFAPALATTFNWDRTTASLSYASGSLGLALASPIIGRLMDKYGAKRIILISIILYAVITACMSFQNGQVWLWVGLSFLAGVTGSATSALGYLVIVPQWFTTRLGLALSLSMLGSGLGMVLVPPTASRIITHLGWSHTYLILSICILLISLLAFVLLKENPNLRQIATSQKGSDSTPVIQSGLSFHQALRHYRFWLLIALFFIAAVATLGLTPHLVTMYTDRGFDLQRAANGASMVGIGVLIGRFITGLILDYVPAPYVTSFVFFGAAIGLALLNLAHTYPLLLLASLLLGLAIGAEGDLISYMVKAYFGLQSLASIVGIIFGVYSLGAIIGPVIMGLFFDKMKSYQVPLFGFSSMMIIAAILPLFLGKYQLPKH